MTLLSSVEIITGAGNTLNTDYYTKDKDVAPSGLTLFAVPRTPIGTTDITITISGLNDDTNNPSDATTVDASSQADSAVMVLNSAAAAAWTDVTTVALDAADYGTAGDIVELIVVPNPTVQGNWTGIDYIRSMDITPGQMIEPVPSDMEPQLVTRRMRMEHSVDVSGEYVDNNTGLAVIRGRETCFMVEHHEDGGPVISEYVILGNAAIQDAPPSAPDNAPITISASGSYRRRLIYAP
jgi:hypothetical protein